jgi:hypothetical protein
MGMNAFTSGSEVSCSMNSLFASILFQQPQLGHFILSFMFSSWCSILGFCLWFRACNRGPLSFSAVSYGHFASNTVTFSVVRSQSHWRLSAISFSIWLCGSSEASGTKSTLITAILLMWTPEGIKVSAIF